MQQFSDKNGKLWLVDVTAGTVADCRKFLNVDITDPTGKVFEKIQTDVCLMVNVLYLACKTQADEAGITDVVFGQAMNGAAIEAAKTALVESIINFFPSHQREAIRAAVAQFNQIQANGAAMVRSKITDPKLAESINQKIETLIDEHLKKLTT